MALELLPVHPLEIPESPEIHLEIHLEPPVLPARQDRPEIPETLRRFPALEKTPYVITPFNK
ncbi:hypothetical protein PghCCS26_35320 [Paenibacillus glycanilyticus]|uniref:Uncharacterized protein n=1 Tax=Paenibacillus glycanilyticus TaxID=126569 RepID=A0ABQ6NPA8_9BACL|nr:hypothetical protein PghCCS26_35320 [Paenibacillus glycanilyticus]